MSREKQVLSIDIETYSSEELKKCGVYRYSESPDFEILLFAYAFDDGEVEIIDMAGGGELPQEVLSAIDDPQVIKAAWNAQFERTCIGRHLGRALSPDSWQCSMVHAASLSLPLSLKDAAKALKTGEQKDRAGENLIKKFSVPQKSRKTGEQYRIYPSDDPEGWERFKEYCRQDVRTERAIRKKLSKYPMREHEWDFYHMDQRINDRGVLIDMELVTQAIAADLALSEAMAAKAYELTGLENPNSVSQLKAWLEERGIEMPSLGRKEVEAMIGRLDKDSCDGEALSMLKLRLKMSKSSVKKYQAAERCVCGDCRARGLFQFNGAARTNRWSGRLIQLQNLARNEISTLDEARELVKMGRIDTVEMLYDSAPDVLSQLVRTMLIPKDGCEFIVADFSAIEARVLAWEAGERWRIRAFARGDDIYCASASQMFGVPVEKHGINGELRQKGKIAELALGYNGSSGALKAMGALEMGISEGELDDLVESWRQANPKIVQFWYDVEKAAMEAMNGSEDTKAGPLQFICDRAGNGKTLFMRLPSGRRLAYISPKKGTNRFGRVCLTFKGAGMNNKWCRQETYGGKLVENATQAIARDILAEAMWRMEEAGLDIVGSVHDEVIIEAPEGKYTVDEVCKIMNARPSWCRDLKLDSAGYKGRYYFKD